MTNRDKRIEAMGSKKISTMSFLECLDLLTEDDSALGCLLDDLDIDATDDNLLQALQDEVCYGVN